MIEKIVENCWLLVPQGNSLFASKKPGKKTAFGYSCNAFLLKGEKRNVLIDSGLQSEAKQLRFNVMETGLKTKGIDLLLHTHMHADHCSADFLFENARVRMQKKDALLIAKEDPLATAARAFGVNYFPKISSFFRKGETINLGNFTLKVLFTPGHTAGSVCFLEQKNKILFSGDTLFSAGVGRTDLPSGNKKQLFESLALLEKTDFEILCPGHGSVLRRNQAQNIAFAMQAMKGI